MLTPSVFPAEGERRQRVALLAGCVQQALAGEINAATIRLLTRHGCEVIVAEGAGCCGALTHHLGQEAPARAAAAANIRAWSQLVRDGGLDAVIVNTSGCGTMVKDYGYQFRGDADLATDAKTISEKARDVCEFLHEIGFRPPTGKPSTRVAYQSPCSMRHGQRIVGEPVSLLRAAGFVVSEPREAHLCCGSAGTYNIFEGELADQLQTRKAAALDALAPDVIASGNIGCMTQLSGAVSAPVVHTVELLDWATGGPMPPALSGNG